MKRILTIVGTACCCSSLAFAGGQHVMNQAVASANRRASAQRTTVLVKRVAFAPIHTRDYLNKGIDRSASEALLVVARTQQISRLGELIRGEQ